MMNDTTSRVYGFDGRFAFLSNFFTSPIFVDGDLYATVEHAFQAWKSLDPAVRESVRRESTPGRAKRAGRRLVMRPDWEEIRDDVMLTLVREKFRTHPDLAAQLVASGAAELVEANGWGDRYWGVDCESGIGRNQLGISLMQVRTELVAAADKRVARAFRPWGVGR